MATTVLSIINNIIDNLDTEEWSRFTGETGAQNLFADGEETILPTVFIDIPLPFTVEVMQSGAIIEKYTPTMIFAHPEELDEEEDTKLENITSMMVSIREFITTLTNHSTVISISNIGGFQTYNLYDRNMTAVIVQLDIEMNTGAPVC